MPPPNNRGAFVKRFFLLNETVPLLLQFLITNKVQNLAQLIGRRIRSRHLVGSHSDDAELIIITDKTASILKSNVDL